LARALRGWLRCFNCLLGRDVRIRRGDSVLRRGFRGGAWNLRLCHRRNREHAGGLQ
jgi:hypothetical protein